MRTFVHHDRLTALIRDLDPMARLVPTASPYWITGPGDDDGADWCARCARHVIRHRRRRDRKHREDYFLDGGYRTEEEGPKFCDGCGIVLRVTLIGYGRSSELEHFAVWGVRPGLSHEAYAIQQLLESLEVTTDAPDDLEMAAEAGDVAEAFLWSCV